MTLFVLPLMLGGPKFAPIRGVAFHLCSCVAPCPCMRSKGEDMEGCQLAAIYHFDDGGYAGKNLKGLTMIVVARPNSLIGRDKKAGDKEPLDLAVYLPAGIDESQERNLKFVLVEHQTRFAWGHADFRKRPIRFKKVLSGYEFSIPGVLRARSVALLDSHRKPRVVDGVPFEEGSRWHLGRTTEHRYTDPKEPAWKWSYPANNGAWCLFRWDRIDHP